MLKVYIDGDIECALKVAEICIVNGDTSSFLFILAEVLAQPKLASHLIRLWLGQFKFLVTAI